MIAGDRFFERNSRSQWFLWLMMVALFYHCTQEKESSLEFSVLSFGAKGDGITNDKDAIQRAFDACRGSGGTVHFPPGNYLTGQLVLGSRMRIQIDSGATILGVQSDEETDYPHTLIETRYPNRMLDDCQRRLLFGNHVKEVTITGKGIIDGQGDFEPWMHVQSLGTEKDRPSILAFVACQNITVEGITLIDPACWTQVYIESDSITIRGVTVHTGNLTPNRDGIDVVDCHQVLIEDCVIQSEDDGICFKSGSEYGCEQITVKDCVIDKLNVRAGNCFKFGTDGLGRFAHFEISGLTLKNAFQNSAIAIESMDGALIDDILIRDCEISHCGQAIFMILADRGRSVPGRETRVGSISNVTFRNIRGSDFTQSYPSILTGIPGHNIQNVTFEKVQLEMAGGIRKADEPVKEYDGNYPEGSSFGNTPAFAFYVRHLDRITFDQCTLTTKHEDARPWLAREDVKELVVH